MMISASDICSKEKKSYVSESTGGGSPSDKMDGKSLSGKVGSETQKK
jgi:hypothetical protein